MRSHDAGYDMVGSAAEAIGEPLAAEMNNHVPALDSAIPGRIGVVPDVQELTPGHAAPADDLPSPAAQTPLRVHEGDAFRHARHDRVVSAVPRLSDLELPARIEVFVTWFSRPPADDGRKTTGAEPPQLGKGSSAPLVHACADRERAVHDPRVIHSVRRQAGEVRQTPRAHPSAMKPQDCLQRSVAALAVALAEYRDGERSHADQILAQLSAAHAIDSVSGGYR